MTIVLIILLILCLVPLGYLFVLLLASLRNQGTPPAQSLLRFAVAIPAHNEDSVIGGTIRALQRVDYPKNLLDIYVVADHCQDETAAIARRTGATVYERSIPERGGKGPALAWLFERIFETGRTYDVFTILDADTHLEPQFFRIMSARFENGAPAVQGNHVIRNANVGWFPLLTWAMFRIDNRVQNMGRANLGFSAKNMGDSICFEQDIIDRLCWGQGLVDDYAFRQELLLQGIPIEYEPRAIGFGQAATNWKEARSQRSRWLMGTYQANQQSAWKMLREGIRKRDRILLEGALSAYMPSYSTLALFVAPITIFSILYAPVASTLLPAIWLTTLVLVIIYPLIALLFDHAPPIAFLVILTGPVYIIWRTVMAITTRYFRQDLEWVRTAHQAEDADSASEQNN